MKTFFGTLIILIGLSFAVQATKKVASSNAISKSVAPLPASFSHKPFDKILKEFVKIQGAVSTVNYKGLKAKESDLKNYLENLSAIKSADFDRWPDSERLAFLINAYNAFTLDWIVTHYPTPSIRKTAGFLGNPWKKKFFKLLEKEMDLDGIEQDLIRKKFNEPRIHFALNCASKGCPALQPEAYRADILDAQLQKSAKLFLSDPDRNSFDRDTKKLELSSIFDWYSDDFVKKSESVQKFVAPFMARNEGEKRLLEAVEKIEFKKYDWTLNE